MVLKVLSMWCARRAQCSARCAISPVRTQIPVTLNVAQKLVVNTECNGWVMLIQLFVHVRHS